MVTAVVAIFWVVPIMAQPAGGWPPVVEASGSAATDPAVLASLARDRSWLAGQPADLLAAPATNDTTVLAEWLRRAEVLRPRASVDTATVDPATAPVSGHRDLLSGLRDRWLERGYMAAAVTLIDPGGEGLPPRILVSTGPLFRLGKLEVEGDPFEGRAQLLAAWLPRSGDIFRPAIYFEAAAGVVSGCGERGYPFPVWLTRDVDVDVEAATIDLVVVLMPGPHAVIGPQSTSLPAGRGEQFLLRTAGLRRGGWFRESDLRRGMDRLLVRNLYARVDEPLVHLTTARDTVGVLWRVEPLERANRVNVVLGFSQAEDGKTKLSGQVDLALPNLAGTGRSLTAGWSNDGAQRSVFGFKYLEPLVLGTPLDTDFKLQNEVQQDLYTLFTVENRWRLPVVGLWAVEVGIAWDRTVYPTGDLESTRRLRGRAGLIRSRGDLSRSGWSSNFAIETASRSASFRLPDSQSGSQLGRQDLQKLLEVDVTGELWLRPVMSLAGRASFRQNDSDLLPVPLAEQYRYGGATTLRGYREDEFHGETVAYGGVELRLGRARRSRVYTFVDLGYFEFSVREGGTLDGKLSHRRDNQLGYGLGLMTAARAGQFNLAVGFPGSVDFDTAKLHISLLGSF